jgi:hypothetical protein
VFYILPRVHEKIPKRFPFHCKPVVFVCRFDIYEAILLQRLSAYLLTRSAKRMQTGTLPDQTVDSLQPTVYYYISQFPNRQIASASSAGY